MSLKKTYPIFNLYGIPFSKMNMADTVAYLTVAIETNQVCRVVTGNPIMLMEALSSPDYLQTLATADLVVPDGAGIVWAAKHLKQPVQERVAGFDLMLELIKLGNKRHWKVYLLGSTDEVVRAVYAKWKQQFPNISLVGYRNGFFTEQEDEEVVAHIRNVAPDLLFVARSANNQETWIAKYSQWLKVPVVMGVGGSFDIIAGKLRRAPLWMQKLRLEWLYRLIQEPKRITRMMVLPKFIVKVLFARVRISKTMKF